MRDIRLCDGCKTEQYALPRYHVIQSATDKNAVFAGHYCEPCWRQERHDGR